MIPHTNHVDPRFMVHSPSLAIALSAPIVARPKRGFSMKTCYSLLSYLQCIKNMILIFNNIPIFPIPLADYTHYIANTIRTQSLMHNMIYTLKSYPRFLFCFQYDLILETPNFIDYIEWNQRKLTHSSYLNLDNLS